MRILIATFTYRPQVNGVANVVSAHVDGFLRRGHEVTVVTGYDERRAATPRVAAGPKVAEFSISGDFRLHVGYRGQVQEYQEFLRRWQGDVAFFHCTQSWPTDLAVPVLTEMRGKKVLVSHGAAWHRYPINCRFPRGLGMWLAGRLYFLRVVKMMRRFDRVVFLSTKTNRHVYYDHLLAQRAGLNRLEVIPTGIYLEDFDRQLPAFRTAFGLEKQRLVLSVGMYAATKNQMFVLRAFLLANPPNTVLVFIGDSINDYARELQRFYEQSGSNQMGTSVLFLAEQPREMVVAAFQAADAFLYGSTWDSGPLVVLEAMATRTAFVSTDVGFVSERPGGIVAHDETEMAAVLNRLLKDDVLRRSLGEEGRMACERQFNWDAIIGRYESLMQELAV
jgi:1,2-diacylglycerol 3-alpha-glucosyltransferase